MKKLSNLQVFLLNDLIFLDNLLTLVIHLSFADDGKFLSKLLALSDTVFENQIDHANVRIEDRLQKNASLDALD